jgi:excinuclease ABC subunit B
MPPFKVNAPYQPTGDQPTAIQKLVEGLNNGLKQQVLVGATGTGKTFVMAQVVEQLQRPTLVMAHNKTLAAQLYAEFKEFFPDNAVCYFVSYYDMYTPEAYVPSKDLYIEKEAQINEEIDRLRHEATQALLSRKDVLIVASVSAIYGLGSPQDYGQVALQLRTGEVRNRDKILRHLIDLQFERNDIDFHRGTFRVRGDTLEIFPANAETAYRIEFWGDEIERMVEVDPLTGELLVEKKAIDIFPAKHFITTGEKLQLAIRDIQAELDERIKELEADGKLLEVQRLKQRTMYDLEMMAEMGYCSGIENYSRHMDRRQEGQTPWTLLDYFPDDFLMFVDESHISVPQVRGMFNGDRSRKMTLVDYGFRLPSALDNRPLTFDEWAEHLHQVVYVSATPGPFEMEHSEQNIEQIIRPTGLLDPMIHVRPTRGQIDDLLGEIRKRVEAEQRALVTTLTKRMAEDLADYLKEMGIRTQYLHADIDTIERVEILRDLRLGVYDVVVGINLLREGLDLPEVSLVAILDADKEGYLRSASALIQTTGRAARHVDGTVIMYADTVTRSMDAAIKETQRRRDIQSAHNKQHGIEPRGIVKQIRDLTNQLKQVAEEQAPYIVGSNGAVAIPKDELLKMIKELEKQMKDAAKNLEFEKAAMLRDQVVELRRTLALEDTTALLESVNERPKPSGAVQAKGATASGSGSSHAGGGRGGKSAAKGAGGYPARSGGRRR